MATLVKQLECKRCGWKWYPRRPDAPKVCPRCKRTDWNKKGQSRDKHFA